MSVTIKVLEVRLELEGNDLEQEFTRLFNDNITRWQRRLAELEANQRLADAERGLGDQGLTRG